MAAKHWVHLESNAGFQSLFQYATIGICIVRADGQIEGVNPCVEKLFGYSAAELIGQSIGVLMPEAVKRNGDGDGYFENVKDELHQQGVKLWAIKKSGYQFLVEISLGHYQSNNQDLVLVFITNVTEKTLSDDKFKVIFYKSPAAKVLSEFETGKIIDINESFSRFSGYSREELIGKTLIALGIISVETRKRWIELLQRMGRLNNNEIEISTKMRQQVFALVSTEQIEIEGSPFLLSTFIDITELKKTNEALQIAKSTLEDEANELKRLNDAGNRLWHIDNLQDGLNEILNSSIELTKADKGDIQLYDSAKQGLYIAASKGFTPAFLGFFKEVNAGDYSTCGIALPDRMQIITEDTEKEWKADAVAIARQEDFRAVQSTPLLSYDGSLIGIISTHFKNAGSLPALALSRMELYALVAESFIERVKNYETIQKQNLELEQKIAERTRELINALEHEKQVNEMKSRFVSTASHEFRTPLTTILSSLVLVKSYHRDEQIEKRNKHITRIETSIQTMIDILNDFLSLERLQQGKVLTMRDRFNFHEFAEDILEELNSFLKKGQRIRYSYDGEKEMVQDKKILRNVLRNLLSNAIKYSEEGKEIILSIKVIDSLVTMEIKDNGIGIPEEDQAHLFSTFFRAQNATNIKGTGLGLSIVKKYVEILNGSICFTSKQGQGTTFEITFPLDVMC